MRKSTVKNISRLHGYWIHKNFLSRTPHWPAERRDEYVLRHLRHTLVRAGEGTPYYRKLFLEAGFDPRTDLKAPEDLTGIPLLTKDDVRADFRSMVDPRYQRLSFVSQTSGTTGQPLRMRLNEYYSAFDYGCIFRQWSWAGYKFRDPVVALRSYVPENDSQPLWRHSRSENMLYFSAYHLTPKNCDQYLGAILKFKPQFLRGYPSSVVVLAEYAYPVRERFADLKGIFTASETLLPTERETIERTFGKKLFDWYGMTEPVLAITECEAHQGMHINWEYGYAEFLPSDELQPNEYRLVATGFHNPVMPFIRYDTGDVVRLYESPRTCQCGRNMPLVESISGRKDECIITLDGRRLPSVNFYTVFRKYGEVLRFQIVQFGHSEVVAKVSLRQEVGGREDFLRRLLEELRVRVGPTVSLDVEITDRFLTNADGKTPPILRKLGTRASEEKDEYIISSQAAWALERAGRRVFKLDWNEADCVPSGAVQDALRSLLDNPHSLCWYPEAGQQLQIGIGSYAGVPPAAIVPTHGSDLAMELTAAAFLRTGDKVLIISPTYDNFRAVMEQRGAAAVEFIFQGEGPFPLADFKEAVRQHTPRLVYLANPNNPMGYALDRETIGRVLECCARLSTVLVVDEAYYEFCGISVADMTQQHSNLLVTRTFSKAFGLAGLRLGYIIAGGEMARILRRLHNPKSVTAFAKAAALAALQEADRVACYVEGVKRNREKFYVFFEKYGIRYWRSQGNFILFQHERPADLINYLESQNVLVRDRSHYFGGVGHIRITVGGDQSTRQALAAMSEYFSGETSGGQASTQSPPGKARDLVIRSNPAN